MEARILGRLCTLKVYFASASILLDPKELHTSSTHSYQIPFKVLQIRWPKVITDLEFLISFPFHICFLSISIGSGSDFCRYCTTRVTGGEEVCYSYDSTCDNCAIVHVSTRSSVSCWTVSFGKTEPQHLDTALC